MIDADICAAFIGCGECAHTFSLHHGATPDNPQATRCTFPGCSCSGMEFGGLCLSESPDGAHLCAKPTHAPEEPHRCGEGESWA